MDVIKMFPSNLAKNTNFSNIVVDNPECDIYIEKELQEAGIEISSGYENWSTLPHKESNGMIIISSYEDYIAKYIPKGEVPYHIIGKWKSFTFVRAWYYYIVKGKVLSNVAKELYEDPIGREDIRVNGNCGCPPPNGNVSTYHIDSQEGLNLFVKIIKKYNINGDE